MSVSICRNPPTTFQFSIQQLIKLNNLPNPNCAEAKAYSSLTYLASLKAKVENQNTRKYITLNAINDKPKVENRNMLD